jgi:hypothetical protein
MRRSLSLKLPHPDFTHVFFFSGVVSVRIWIGLKQDEEYVHEWVGELSEEDDIADAKCNFQLHEGVGKTHLGNDNHDR